MKRILCIRLPNWPVQRLGEIQGSGKRGREARDRQVAGGKLASGFTGNAAASSPPSVNPEVVDLRLPSSSAICNPQSAILLHSRDPRRGNCVVACSREAQARGVRLGMPLAEAAALAGHGGNFLSLAHDPAADLAALACLAEKCERFSPLVGWETVECRERGTQSAERGASQQIALGPAHLFLDITGIGRLLGGEENLIAEVRRDFAREGYEIHAAAAETIGAAWALAGETGDRGQGTGDRQAAGGKLASGFTRDDAALPSTNRHVNPEVVDLRLIASHSPLFTLHSTLVSALRLPPETLDLLVQLGITQIGELLRLPRETLTARFGERLLLRIDQLLGTAQELIVPYRPPPRFQADWVLEYPTDSREVAERIVSELLARVAADLARRQEGVMQLACRLDGAGGRPLQLMVSLYRPSAVRKHLEDLVRMQLDETPLPPQIGRIGIEARLTAPLEIRQRELFAGADREVSREFAMLVDRLSSRLGCEAVLQPVLRQDPLPERAVWYRAAVKRGARSRKRAPRSEFRAPSSLSPVSCLLSPVSCLLSPVSFLRPLLLHHPPLPLAVVSVVPDGPPISFEWQGRTHRVARSWGPERIETGWWRGSSLRRDYYRIETTTGHRFWLFRQIDEGSWSLQGEY